MQPLGRKLHEVPVIVLQDYRFLHKTEMCFERGSIISRRLTIN